MVPDFRSTRKPPKEKVEALVARLLLNHEGGAGLSKTIANWTWWSGSRAGRRDCHDVGRPRNHAPRSRNSAALSGHCMERVPAAGVGKGEGGEGARVVVG